MSSFGLGSVQTLVASACVPLLVQEGDAGAAHGHGHVDLGVGVSTCDAGAGPLQDDGGSVDRSAAEVFTLLTVGSQQAAFTQTVGLRDVTGVTGRVIGDP